MGLKDEKYLMLEVLMYVEKDDSLQFMFNITKKAREFLENNYKTFRNGF